jgi:hypothetical protein
MTSDTFISLLNPNGKIYTVNLTVNRVGHCSCHHRFESALLPVISD